MDAAISSAILRPNPNNSSPFSSPSPSPHNSLAVASSTSSPVQQHFPPLSCLWPKEFGGTFVPLAAALNQLQQMLAAGNAELFEQAKQVERAALEMALMREQFCRKISEEQLKRVSTDSPPSAIAEEPFLTRCGITWKFLKSVNTEREFDQFRRGHQVSKNRHVGYGVRYACTRNAKARDNCPYLMLCMPDKDGTLKVFYRNSHTHPIRHIRTRECQQ